MSRVTLKIESEHYRPMKSLCLALRRGAQLRLKRGSYCYCSCREREREQAETMRNDSGSLHYAESLGFQLTVGNAQLDARFCRRVTTRSPN